ncbi:uncharacterized protein LOC107882156 isoform X2 [Acyrthosiphon pisum]|uniref:Tc1-like transposase DDE domain-containing protein n=1 Tax=Acyrthosiphon pisum TaxID=7029 RepID=A0A8R2D180_ACYPI|nr:uncharacterized protein LOC107882156 isoform X2 [Acyrthosiphon pisum]|eukprot:XP_016656461.1 PREDICTED: uncharacterized protein LOC107882156 isoform X2 [Acyrthosiphon pisum]
MIMSDHHNLCDVVMDEEGRLSPKRKNPSGKLVSSGQREIIVNMYKDIKSKHPEMKYRPMILEINQTTGIGRQTICSTISEYRRTGSVSSPNKKRNRSSLLSQTSSQKPDDLDRNTLRKKVYSIWLRRELPTINRILAEVNKDPVLPNFKRTAFDNIIKNLDFVFTKWKKHSVLTENEDLIVWRRNYLNDIRKYREEDRTIYYLDETSLNAGDFMDQDDQVLKDKSVVHKHEAFNKGIKTDLENLTGNGNHLILFHIGSNKGFLKGGLLCFESKMSSGDYHDEINGDHFKEWFESILPRLEPNSIVVMDNAPYHSTKSEQIPTLSSKKTEILEWLNSKGVTFDKPLLKLQLLVKVRELKPRFSSYVIDKLATNSGHTVLRLPPNHNKFNPIKLAWAMMKGYVKRNNETFKVDSIRKLVNMAIDRVTKENWKNFINNVIEEENKIWIVDDIMDEMLD